jgi:hypothetical protein
LRIKLACALFALISIGRAQTVRGVISGVVKDPTGAPMPASVSVMSQETGAKRTVSANMRGEYAIVELAPGQYRIEADSKGFKKFGGTLRLSVDQDFRFDIQMALGGMDTVDVSADQELVREDSSTYGGLIENRMVVGLPLDGRNFYDLSLLLPGVVPPAQGSAGSVRGALRSM